MRGRFLILAAVVIILASIAFAQSDRASIKGRVTDESGAVVSGAVVAARNVATNVAITATTNSQGLYAILNLPNGEFTLSFSKDGFATIERKGVSLLVSQVAEIDAKLTVGKVTEVVTIVANASVLQTETAAISTNLTNDVVSQLPMNVHGGRTLSKFMFDYVPGVEGDDYDSHIAGSLSKNKEVMIDGTSAVSQVGGYLNESQPPMEAVQEFQVTTAGIRADESRTGGGVFRYNLKSGTNDWHGSGLLYLQNEALNANSWSNNYHQFARPKDRLYDYGASFGGPIKKNRTFFFAAWERYTFENLGLGNLGQTVPTTDFLNGDFSSLLDTTRLLGTDTGGHPVYKGAIIDPATGLAFPGNVIPEESFSPISKQIVAIYKAKYSPLSSALTNNNAMPLDVTPRYVSNMYSVKLDHKLSDKHMLAGSFTYALIPRTLADKGGVWSAGSADGGPFANSYSHRTTAPSVRVSESYNISDKVLNVATATLNRYHNASDALSQKGDWSSSLGLGSFGAGNFPIIDFQGINGDHFRTAADGTPIYESQLGSQFNGFYAANTYIFGDNLSWVRGRHTMKFGAEFRAMQLNSHADTGVPTFVFDPAQTAGRFGGNAGFGFASFLLGTVNQASVSEPNDTYGRRKSFSLYAMDDFKVSQRLTMTFDLRWDFNGRYHEKFGHWSNFSTTLINPTTGQPGALEFAKDGSDSFERKQYYHNFSGNIGAAYKLGPKTIVRGSFGLFYVPLNLNAWSGIPYAFNPGFVKNNQYLTPFSWDSGYPGQAVKVDKDPNFIKWGMVSIDPRSLLLGNTQQWLFGVQNELTKDLRLDVNLTVSNSYHLQSGYLAGNQPKLSDYSAIGGDHLWDWVTEPGFSGYAWAAVAPFPNLAAAYSPLYSVGAPLGNSDYKSLQVSLSNRRAHGLTLLASYNYSATHGDTDTSFQELWSPGPLQDVYNLRQERHTIASYDMTHVVKGYVNYELPVGRGKLLLADARPLTEALLGDWTISSGIRYNSGTPIRIIASSWYPGINTVYANLVPNCDLHVHYNGQVGGTYFNPACFSNPDYGSFGNAPGYLGNLRYPHTVTEDIGLNKAVTFKDGRYQLSLRFDVFNALNHHRFAGPNTMIGDPRFGTVTEDKLSGLDPRVSQFAMRFSF